MEIKAKRGDLLATLYWTQSIVERRNTMPILANVLIEAQKGDIRVTATDLEVGVRGQVEGEVAKEGTITVSAKKLYEIVREVPNEQIQLKRLETIGWKFVAVSRFLKSLAWTPKNFLNFRSSIAKDCRACRLRLSGK